MADEKPLFTTGPKGSSDKRKNGNKSSNKGTYSQGDNKGIRIGLEKKKRGGKSVTTISNLPFNSSEAKEYLKQLKQLLACGGALKGSDLEIAGDSREKILAFFTEKKIKAKII